MYLITAVQLDALVLCMNVRDFVHGSHYSVKKGVTWCRYAASPPVCLLLDPTVGALCSALSPQPTRMDGTFAAGAPTLIPYSLVVPVFYHSTANSNADADSISILMRGHGPNFTALATAAMDRNHQNAHQGMKGFKVRYIQNGTRWHNKKNPHHCDSID